MKRFAPIIAIVSTLAVTSAQAQSLNPWNPTPSAPTQQTTAVNPPVWSNTQPVVSPFAPADLEQRLSSGSMPLAPAQMPSQMAPQAAPIQQAPAQSQYAPLRQTVPAGQQYQLPPYGTPMQNYGMYNQNNMVPNYGYGGLPGNYGYNLPYGFGTGIPYGNNFGSPFGNGFGGFPFNSGGYGSPVGSQYGSIPSGSSPFFGGNSPFGFW